MQPRLPEGFRFRPTDEELLSDYLHKKVLGEELPSAAVIDGEVDGDEAQMREGIGRDGEKFIFVKRKKKNKNGNKNDRSARNGHWKVTGNQKVITNKSGRRIGIKRTLVFIVGNSTSETKQKLHMDEYVLDESMIPENAAEWYLCRIKLGNGSPESEETGRIAMEATPAGTSSGPGAPNLADDSWLLEDHSELVNECLRILDD